MAGPPPPLNRDAAQAAVNEPIFLRRIAIQFAGKVGDRFSPVRETRRIFAQPRSRHAQRRTGRYLARPLTVRSLSTLLQWQNGGHAQRRGFANHSSFCLRLNLAPAGHPLLSHSSGGARWRSISVEPHAISVGHFAPAQLDRAIGLTHRKSDRHRAQKAKDRTGEANAQAGWFQKPPNCQRRHHRRHGILRYTASTSGSDTIALRRASVGLRLNDRKASCHRLAASHRNSR